MPVNRGQIPIYIELVNRMKGLRMPDEIDMTELRLLAEQLVLIRAQILAEGGFLHDRELHQCPACGLMEDVLYSGKLVTYWHQNAEPVDTGLRFKEVEADELACPCCGCVSFADSD
jgi:hypothetical protein